MTFRTEISFPPPELPIGYHTQLLSMGSCFANRIGIRLQQAKFPISVNPLGIAYHPLALIDLLEMLIENRLPEIQYSETEECWHSFALHSRFNHSDKSVFETQLQEAFAAAREVLARTEVLLLTLGTAMGYRRLDTGTWVNNCHKYPARQFEKQLLPLPELKAAFAAFLPRLQAFCPGIQLLLTVSPVRHQRDTLLLNSVSKATLRLLCHELVEAESSVHYFPAYEIMMDELRDYRFYASDMLHPSEVAEQYIWEKWSETYVTPAAKQSLSRWQEAAKDLAHRPRQPHSQTHLRFLEQLKGKLSRLNEEMDCRAELKWVAEKLRDQMGSKE